MRHLVKVERGPRGWDAGMKVRGRKRRIVVDTLGFLIAVLAYPADQMTLWPVDKRVGNVRIKGSRTGGRLPRLARRQPRHRLLAPRRRRLDRLVIG